MKASLRKPLPRWSLSRGTINLDMYLYGASGHAKVVMDILVASGEPVCGLVDDNPEVNDLNGHQVYRQFEGFSPFIVSIGSNAIRKKIVEKLGNVPFGKAIHPSAIISPSVSIEEGTVVMQGAVVQADTRIGRHGIINTGASVDHECVIDDFVHISPHCTLCGNVRVGEGSWIGAGTTIIPGVRIGRWCVIGAGSVVTEDVPDGVLAIGNRCKTIKSLDIDILIKVNQGGVKYLIDPIRSAKEGIDPTIKGGKNNILVTSAGKRVMLINIFKEALSRYDSEAKVFTTDMNPQMAPAGMLSDGCLQVPRVTDTGYIEVLLAICLENNIKLVIPTIDTELAILAENKPLFEEHGIILSVSDPFFIKICRDKRNTGEYLKRLGIRVPAPVDKYNPVFPLFAKPYDGSLSKDLHVVRCLEELTPEILNNPKLIFMEYINKSEYKEFTVDMYYGKDNRVKSIVPRERIEVRAGEINKGRTRKNYLVRFLKERMGYLQGVVGCICVQLFYRESNDDVVGIEINPRFGGGYPLSYHAGANFAEYLIKEYFKNEPIDYSEDWLDNTLMLRYDSEVIVYE